MIPDGSHKYNKVELLILGREFLQVTNFKSKITITYNKFEQLKNIMFCL